MHRDASLSVKAVVVDDTTIGRQASDTGLPSRAARRVRDSGSVFGTTAVAALAVVCLTGGCSPYVYKNEIQGFAVGVEQLGVAYAAGQEALVVDRLAAQRAAWVARRERPRLALTVGCVAPGPAGQDVCAVAEAGRAPSPPTSVEAEAGKAGSIGEALVDYAEGLAAITRAEDREAFDNARAELSNGLTSLLERADAERPAAEARAPRLGPVADLVGWAAGAYLDQRRYTVLKAAVTRAHPDIEALGGALGVVLRNIAEQRRLHLVNEAKSIQERIASRNGRPVRDDPAYEDLVQALEARAEVVNELIASEPEKAAEAMVTAHAKLRDALASNQGQLDVVVGSIKDFAAKARKVREAFAPASTRV